MIRRLAICLIILISSLPSMALDAVVSHTVFYKKEGNDYRPVVEVYWQANPRKLHYKTTQEKKIVARLRTDIFFITQNGIVKEDHFILQTTPRTTVAELEQNNVFELRRYEVPAGPVTLKFVLTDMADSTRPFVNIDSFSTAPAATKAFFSGIQLLDTTIESAAETPFRKNGHQQIPTCANFFDESQKAIHYYAELYGTQGLSKNTPLIQKVCISKRDNEGCYGDLFKTDTITPKDINLVSGSINIASLPSGNYYLRVTLGTGGRNLLAAQSLFFQRLNPHPAVEQDSTKKTTTNISDTGMESVNLLDLSKTFVAHYSSREIREILKMLLPVSDPLGTQNINNFLKNPDDLYMRYYFYNYFLLMDRSNPEHAWKEYSNKVIETNRRYTSHGNHGYETDRGFMFLRYGEPTEVITVENEPGSLPYEIWQYNNLKQTNGKEIVNAIFLFYRPLPTSDFRLLHSTVDGEVQNPTWRTYLYPAGSGANTTGTSRAEETIGNR